jgi:hypothetical protein
MLYARGGNPMLQESTHVGHLLLPWHLLSLTRIVAQYPWLDRYANCDGVFVLVCSGSLEANGVKKLIEIVCDLLIEPIQQSSFVVLELGVSPVRLK